MADLIGAWALAAVRFLRLLRPRERKINLSVLEWRLLTLKYMDLCAEKLDPEDAELVREAMEIIGSSLLMPKEVQP